MHGYLCTMRTDTEVVAYAADLIMRRHGLPSEIAAAVFASPLWHEMEHMPESERCIYRALRQTYGSLLLNGPFTVIIARNGEMIGLGDRIRLRPLVSGIKGNILYVSSELSAIYIAEPQLEVICIPQGGQPIIGRLGEAPRFATPTPQPAFAEKEPSYA